MTVDLSRPEFNPSRHTLSQYTSEQLVDLKEFMEKQNEKRYKETGKESESFCHQITVIKKELHARADDVKYGKKEIENPMCKTLNHLYL